MVHRKLLMIPSLKRAVAFVTVTPWVKDALHGFRSDLRDIGDGGIVGDRIVVGPMSFAPNARAQRFRRRALLGICFALADHQSSLA